MTTATDARAVRGRRVEFTYYRDLDQADGPVYPGIITGTEPGLSGTLLARIRLDGTRSNLSIPVAYEGIKYLNEVVLVPDLPMGAFTPVADDRMGFYEKAGVLLTAIGEDGEDIVVITSDLDEARAAVTEYAQWAGYDPDYMNLDALHPYMALFTWEREDAECPWTVSFADRIADNQAVHIYYLPS